MIIKTEKVNHPKHYNLHPSGIECIEVIRHLNHNVGAAIKYIWRAGLKQDPEQSEIEAQITDIRKAIWYLEDEIKRLQGVYDDKTTLNLFSEKEIPACIKPEADRRYSVGGLIGGAKPNMFNATI